MQDFDILRQKQHFFNLLWYHVSINMRSDVYHGEGNVAMVADYTTSCDERIR